MSTLTTVILDDFITDARAYFVFSQDEFDVLTQHWTDTDQLLQALQNTEYFKGYDTWDKLEIEHWKVLVANNIEKYQQLSVEEQSDLDNSVVNSLQFLMMGFITRLQALTDSLVELLRIQIVKGDKGNIYTFNYESSLPSMSFDDDDFGSENIENHNTPNLQISVDNSDKDEEE